MKKFIRFSIIVAIFIPLLAFVIVFVYNNLRFNHLLNKLVPQDRIPCYVKYNTIYDDGIEIDLSDYSWNDYGCLEVFTKYCNKYYFVYGRYDSDNRSYWGLATVDASKQINVLFESEFYSYIKGGSPGYKLDNHLLPIKQRNGFYHEGYIYLTDFEKVVMFNLFNNDFEEFKYTQFDYPQKVFADINENGEVIISSPKDNDFTILTFDTLSKDNGEVSKISKMRNFEIWSDLTSVNKLAEVVQVFGNKIYILTPILNYNGSTYVAIIEYDQSNQISKFLGYKYLGDVISKDFYLISNTEG